MNKYLDAIGFHKMVSERAWRKCLQDAENSYNDVERFEVEEGLELCKLRKEYGPRIGIWSCGFIEESRFFSREYYCPYFEGSQITTYADVVVDKRSDRESYIGICEDSKVGISLIFDLQNDIEVLKHQKAGEIGKQQTSVTLSGLCVYGKVLLPVFKDNQSMEASKEDSYNRKMLLSAARKGDSKAIESLTMDDIDTYSVVSRRLRFEDVYSIVDTYIMPNGVEIDQYSVLGEIKNFDIVMNNDTQEAIYILTLDVNELVFDVCVPAECIYGVPEVGRRFKGEILLQGKINY